MREILGREGDRAALHEFGTDQIYPPLQDPPPVTDSTLLITQRFEPDSQIRFRESCDVLSFLPLESPTPTWIFHG